MANFDLVATSSISNSGFSQHVGPTISISLPESAKPLVATSSILNSGFSQHVGPTISLPESAKPVDYFMAYFDDDLL